MKDVTIDDVWAFFPDKRRTMGKAALELIIKNGDTSDIGLDAGMESLWNICRGDDADIEQSFAWIKSRYGNK